MLSLLSEMEEYASLKVISHLKLISSEESLKKKLKSKILILPTTSPKNKLLADLEIIEDSKGLEDKVAIANKEATEDQEGNMMVTEDLEEKKVQKEELTIMIKDKTETKDQEEHKLINLEENKVIDHQEENKAIENPEENKAIDLEERKVIKKEITMTEDQEEKKVETETTDQKLNGPKSVPLNQERKD